MSGAKSQGQRIARLTTPLGTDVLVAARFDGHEAISDLFEYRIEALSSDPDIDLDALIGRNATMSLQTPDGGTRLFDGIAVEAEWLGQRYEDFVYRFVLRPWFWLLTRRTDCRIFHERTAPDIVSAVLSAHPFAAFENRLTKNYPPLEYTVQYRESDFSFCCRMMEKHGIGYYFRHQEGGHVLVLSDSLSSYEPLAGGPRLFYPKQKREHVDGEHVNLVVPQRRFASGRVMLNAYDFKKPAADLRTRAQGPGPYEHSDLEIYDYPGQYVETGQGRAFSDAQLAAEQSHDGRRLIGGDLPSAFPGALFQLSGHPRASENNEYLVLAATHSFGSQGYRSGDNDESAYSGRYEAMASDTPYAPAMRTTRARVFGPQTAVVVGEGEIDVDEYGRILVRFHWDRENGRSKRLRVAQNSASRGWGGMIIPRIGMEVIVEFLEGDPDEPIVTGCVYHARNMPTNTLPRYKTRSALRTDTHQGSGYNELRFEDERDQQEVFLQAEKYLNVLVKQDETHKVEGAAHLRVEKSRSQSVGGDEDVRVDGRLREAIGGSHDYAVGAARTGSITGDEALKIGGAMAVKVAADTVFDTGAAHVIKAGQRVVIEAGATITLSAGASFMRIGPAGVEIEGPMVRINCGSPPPQPEPPNTPAEPAKYAGPHAERYPRSFQN